MSELTKHIDAILDAYSGVPDDEANQPMTLTVPVRDLRTIAKALRPEGRDAERLDWLHKELKVTVAYALKWPTIPQDLTSWRAKLDEAIGAPQSHE